MPRIYDQRKTHADKAIVREAKSQKEEEIFTKLQIFKQIDEVDNKNADQEKQAAVLNKLPPLVAHLKKHLESSLKIEKEFKVEKGLLSKEAAETYTFNEKKKRGILAGEIFEMLVRAEFSEYDNQLSSEIVNVWHDPERYGLSNELGRVRNPDLAYVEITEDEQIILHAAGEVKLGLLDPRSFEQLKENVFRNNIEEIRKQLKILGKDKVGNPKDNMNMLHMLGFTDLADKINNLKIAESNAFLIHLILPSNRDIPEDDDENTKRYDIVKKLINRHKFKKEYGKDADKEINKFAKFLRSKNKTKLKKSSFSTSEVWSLVDLVIDEL